MGTSDVSIKSKPEFSNKSECIGQPTWYWHLWKGWLEGGGEIQNVTVRAITRHEIFPNPFFCS